MIRFPLVVETYSKAQMNQYCSKFVFNLSSLPNQEMMKKVFWLNDFWYNRRMKYNITKLAVVGSRTFQDYSLLRQSILDHVNIEALQTIISGGATGADALAERFAAEFHLQLECYPADWRHYGRAAGPKRNSLIAQACDACIAFPIGSSPGTTDAIKKCRAKAKPVFVIATP
jgi:hypothetical protein